MAAAVVADTEADAAEIPSKDLRAADGSAALLLSLGGDGGEDDDFSDCVTLFLFFLR